MSRTCFEEPHELFRGLARSFAERELVPNRDLWEDAGIVDRSLFEAAGKSGLLGTAAPIEFGGEGEPDFRYNAVRIEEFARAGVLTPGQGIGMHTDVALPYFLKFTNDDQKRRWLPGLCNGELIAAVAMTEPGAGSDLAGLSARAVRDGDDYVLNGTKTFISNGILCDIVIVVCRTGGRGVNGLSLIAVERDTPGFGRGRNLKKIGLHSQDTAELFFEDVRVPAANLLGEENRGFYYLMDGLAQERLSIALGAVAQSEAALEETLAYVKQRHAFGQPIASFQNSRFLLASLRTEVDIARVYVDRQLAAHVAGELSGEDAAAAKWWTTELSFRLIDSCLQLHGGWGYMEEYPIAQHWRDSRLFRIAGGTTEIMKEIIGRRVLGV
ncbi:acyl-CoA dehydrogenase family protein [[Mycobacterium] burgundiense]|uniref:Acyl-[acyl-carrier-protein] dehydrogenase MbtN n=1 Tax=[Mycobacterium] burgundiense TaxID=3064286 RepID=A0ABM9LKF7_9MYCO|nr:acyl-CoA dehydrogenase family protein [Mycolicibacterium sp. MU0053]CAJ1500594.1 acyl-CoA dehydrogenase family protein [Mycolicibacterium sp. MU0053]